jgi:uncharacterized protein (TIGR03435 family)
LGLKKIALLIVVTSCVLPAQPAAFEAASIHPLVSPYSAIRVLRISGTRITLDGYNIQMLVSEAFGVKDYQVSADSVPRSALDVFYRIEARAGGGSAPGKAEVGTMLQALPADRFHLAIHRDTRKTPVYALLADSSGPALKPASGAAECAGRIGPVRPNDRSYRYAYSNCPLDRLADNLLADRPILNQTGLTGQYDIEIFATPEFMMRDTSQPGDISVHDAIRKLGLRLVPQNAPLEVIVIDHIDPKPSPN